jgi:hypothetical protein
MSCKFTGDSHGHTIRVFRVLHLDMVPGHHARIDDIPGTISPGQHFPILPMVQS